MIYNLIPIELKESPVEAKIERALVKIHTFIIAECLKASREIISKRWQLQFATEKNLKRPFK